MTIMTLTLMTGKLHKKKDKIMRKTSENRHFHANSVKKTL